MKNKKILVGILSASGIAMTLPAITSCSCRGNINNPEVSTETPKKREVGAKATRTYFYITQGNINNPDETKVKLINLKVNGAEASPVSGLIKFSADSAGNILVVFNMSLAQKQYNANTITFDLKLTNKKANTEYVVKDFEISVSSTLNTVTYDVSEGKGITFTSKPESVGIDEKLEMKFTLEPGYKWDTDLNPFEVTVNGNFITNDLFAAQDAGADIFSLYQGGLPCYLNVPGEFVTEPSSEIVVLFRTVGEKYNTAINGNNFSFDSSQIGTDKAQHGTDYSITITPDEHYSITNEQIVVTTGGTALTAGTDYNYSGTTLTINGSKILGDVVMTVTPKPDTYKVEVGPKSGGLQLLLDEFQGETATYNVPYVFRYTLDAGHSIVEDSLKCSIFGRTFPITTKDGLILNKTAKTVTVPANYVTGNLYLAGSGELETYKLSSKVKGFTIKTPAPTPTYHTQLVIPVEPAAGYVFNQDDFDGDDPKITIKVGKQTLSLKAGHFSISESAKTITIDADKIEGDVTIAGEITKYKTNITSTTTGAFTDLPKDITYTKQEPVNITATLASGYSSPEVTISCGGTELEEETDYTKTITDTTVSVVLNSLGASKVTAPLTIAFDAQSTEIEFLDPQLELAVGDTSLEGYLAHAHPSRITPFKVPVTLDQEGTTATGTELNNDKKLVAGATPGIAKLRATYQGATATQDVAIKKPTLTVTGATEVEVSKTTNLAYTWGVITPSAAALSGATISWSSSNPAYATINETTGVVTGVAEGNTNITVSIKYGNLQNPIVSATYPLEVKPLKEITISGEHKLDAANTTGIQLSATYLGTDITSSSTWTVSAGSAIEMDASTKGLVKVSSTGSTIGGSATVTCEYAPTNGNDKVTKTWEIEVASWAKINVESDFSVTCNTDQTGLVIVPSRVWSNDKWNTVERIWGFGGLYRVGITQVVIPQTVKTIDSETFNFASISQTSSLNSIIFTGESQLETIGDRAFCYATITSITFPKTLKSIGKYVFSPSSLNSITFSETSNWYIATDPETAISASELANPTTNATILKDSSKTWTSNGLIRKTS